MTSLDGKNGRRGTRPLNGSSSRCAQKRVQFGVGDCSGEGTIHRATVLFVLAGLLLGAAATVNPAAASALRGDDDSPAACSRSLIFNFEATQADNTREVPVWRIPDSSAFFFEDGMTIDADGAPNAYNPDNTGLDDLANAGSPGHWGALAVDHDGMPYIQGPDDPFPGYYVSTTSLSDRTRKPNDPRKYVDASKIPFIVLPHDVTTQTGARLGDFAVVLNVRNGKTSSAIFADIGTMGEGSVALADNLGLWSNAREGGTRRGILYLVFVGSGNGKPRSSDEINEQAEGLLRDWGGTERMVSCSAN
jgi:glycosyl hydrolase group 75 (putative chitosanase)